MPLLFSFNNADKKLYFQRSILKKMSFNLEMRRFLFVILLHTLLLKNHFINQRQLKNSVQKISIIEMTRSLGSVDR